MTAQLANGGFKIYPKITVEKNDQTAEEIKLLINQNSNNINDNFIKEGKNFFNSLVKNKHEKLF